MGRKRNNIIIMKMDVKNRNKDQERRISIVLIDPIIWYE
jgi:hypothetical protein